MSVDIAGIDIRAEHSSVKPPRSQRLRFQSDIGVCKYDSIYRNGEFGTMRIDPIAPVDLLTSDNPNVNPTESSAYAPILTLPRKRFNLNLFNVSGNPQSADLCLSHVMQVVCCSLSSLCP